MGAVDPASSERQGLVAGGVWSAMRVPLVPGAAGHSLSPIAAQRLFDVAPSRGATLRRQLFQAHE